MGSCCSSEDDIDGVYNDDPEGRGRDAYQRERRLGGGTFGEVFRVKGTDSRKHYAMKVVLKKNTTISALRGKKRAFLNETNILRELSRENHPHILQHFHSFEDKKGFYIITELCRGVSLFDRITACGTIKDGAHPFTERAAARITLHMLRALDYIHSKGVVHRDIKPENFLFRTTKPMSALKLIDFGEAVRLISPDQRIFNVAGSEYYLAPEVLPTEAASFRRTLREWKSADVWSVGVVLYVCLFGRPPFVGSDAMATFHRIKRGEFKIPDVTYVSENAISFIKGLLRQPKNRLSVEEALQHPFITSGDTKDEPIPAAVLTALVKFKRHCKLKRVVGRFMANKMKKEDKETLKKVFREFDQNGDGMLDKGELTDLMRSIQSLDNEAIRKFKRKKYVYGATEAEEMMKAQDQVRKDSEAITEEDFVSMYAAHHIGKTNSKEELRNAFDSMDIDHDGFVTAEDLHTSCGFMTPNTCQAIARESADVKDNSKISFQAFVKAIKNTPSYSNPPTPRMRSLRNKTREWSRQNSRMGTPVTPPISGPGGSGMFSAANALAGYQAPRIGNNASPNSIQQNLTREPPMRSGTPRSNIESLKQPLLGRN